MSTMKNPRKMTDDELQETHLKLFTAFRIGGINQNLEPLLKVSEEVRRRERNLELLVAYSHPEIPDNSKPSTDHHPKPHTEEVPDEDVKDCFY